MNWTWIVCVCIICVTIIICVYLANVPDFGIKSKTKLNIIQNLVFGLSDGEINQKGLDLIKTIRKIINS